MPPAKFSCNVQPLFDSCCKQTITLIDPVGLPTLMLTIKSKSVIAMLCQQRHSFRVKQSFLVTRFQSSVSVLTRNSREACPVAIDSVLLYDQQICSPL